LATGKVIGLGILLELIDKVTGPSVKVTRQFKKTQISAQELGSTMVKVGAAMTAVGAGMSFFAVKTVTSTFATQKALGELASLGIKDLGLIEKKATAVSNRFAGITKPQFVTAAYDIKSAISNLTDSAVADYTRLAAITAKATKGNVEQMGDLFATGYGIYKELFPKLSDARFAEVFSGAIAKTVQEFKMTGPKIAEYVSLLGASATKQRVPLAEQFAIGGMLGATMSGSEAATKYGAFLKQPVKAAKKLGLTFTDANNKLLPMADILDRIRGKFGDFIDAAEKGKLMEAFGRIEGVKLVELLIGKTDELRRKTQLVNTAMGSGADVALKMAYAIDKPIGQQWIILKQQVHNTMEILGKGLFPIAEKIHGIFSKLVISVQKFAQNHPGLVRIATTLGAIAGVALVLVGGLITLGGTVLIATASMGGLVVLLGLVKTAILGIGAAGITLLTNPIFLAISLIAVGAYLIIKYWTPIKGFFSSVGKWIINIFVKVKDFIFSLPGELWNAGKNMILSLWEGIKSYAMWPVNKVKEIAQHIRNLWPFSPAKEGPLRNLDKAGVGFVQQLAVGMERGQSKIRKAAIATATTGLLAYSATWGSEIAPKPTASVMQKIGYELKTTSMQTSPLRKQMLDPHVFDVPLPPDYYIATVPLPPDYNKNKSNKVFDNTGSGSGIDGGLGGFGSGTTIYITQHFENGSIVNKVDRLDSDSFRKLVGRVFQDMIQEAG